MTLLGCLIVFKSLTFETDDGGPIGPVAWRPLLTLVGSMAIFALVAPVIGLLLTLPAMAYAIGRASGGLRHWLVTGFVTAVLGWLVFGVGFGRAVADAAAAAGLSAAEAGGDAARQPGTRLRGRAARTAAPAALAAGVLGLLSAALPRISIAALLALMLPVVQALDGAAGLILLPDSSAPRITAANHRGRAVPRSSRCCDRSLRRRHRRRPADCCTASAGSRWPCSRRR